MTANTTDISLYQYIEAPEPLIEAPTVLRRAIDVLKILDEISVIELLPESSSISEWIQEARFLSQQSPEPEQERKNRRDPLRGLYKEHQPYVTLWHRPGDDHLRVNHDHLLAHLLIANHACRAYEAEGDVFDSARRAAFTFGRSICRPSNSAVLSLIPAMPLSSRGFLSAVETISKDYERVNAFAVFLRYSQGLRKGITRDGSSRVKSRIRKPTRHETDADPGQQSIITTITKIPMLSRSLENEVVKSGLAPTEFEHYQEFLETSFSEKNPMEGREAIDHAIRSRHVAKQISMHNQLLLHRWDLLSMPEVAFFLREVVALYRKAHNLRPSPQKNEETELAALISMIFWFSLPLEKALQAKAHRSCPKYPAASVEFVLEENGAKWLFVESVRPDYRSRSSRYRYAQTSSHIILNTGLDIESIIAEHFALSNYRSNLFVRDINEYRDDISGFLAHVNSRYGIRLTLNRIANFMLFTLEARSDITYAMLMTGRQINIGSTPLYYTTVTSQMLQDVFRQTCQWVAHHVQREMGYKKKAVDSFARIPADELLGARIRPSDENVRQLCRHLRQRVLHDAKRNPLILHNTMTLYTAVMINFSTGYRAVRDASFRLDEIDQKTGLAVISDKDSFDEYHSRLIWLPDKCLKQIRIYFRHLKHLRAYTAIKLPDVDRQLAQSLEDRSRYSLPGLFLIEQDRALPLTPGKYEELMPECYPYPANAHRHFLRQSLLKGGCPSDIIHAFLGHWERGQEPWARFSSLGPLEYVEILAPFINDILDTIGLEMVDPYK